MGALGKNNITQISMRQQIAREGVEKQVQN
jgi:hypothetical protein